MVHRAAEAYRKSAEAGRAPAGRVDGLPDRRSHRGGGSPMPRWSRWSIVLAPVALAACSGASASKGAGGAGPRSCFGVTNAPGPPADFPWPVTVNTGHDAPPGSTVHFHWTGSHNV